VRNQHEHMSNSRRAGAIAPTWSGDNTIVTVFRIAE
jgi:hypothetical protein